jgi:dihydroflavonol-4-reductase
MHLLLTGANGYLGRHIAARALAEGHRLRVTLRDPARAADIRAAIGAEEAALEAVPLDLLRGEGWDAAMEGIEAVIHAASPVPIGAPKRDVDVIRPAVEGTERVLAAAGRAGVGRVVVTSSIAAVLSAPGKAPGETFTAADWTDPAAPGVRAYARAKAMAERAARSLAAEARIPLVTVNPGLVVGPPLGGGVTSSLALIDRLVKGRDPLLPRIAIPATTTRDVAEAHLRALGAEDGARFLMVGDTLALREVAEIVRRAVPAARPSRIDAPDWAVRLLARVSPSVRGVAGGLGRFERVERAPVEALLGRPLEDPRPAIAETARALAGA